MGAPEFEVPISMIDQTCATAEWIGQELGRSGLPLIETLIPTTPPELREDLVRNFAYAAAQVASEQIPGVKEETPSKEATEAEILAYFDEQIHPFPAESTG